MKKSTVTSSSPFADVKGNILGRTAYRPSFIVTASMLRRNLQNLCPPPPRPLYSFPHPLRFRKESFLAFGKFFGLEIRDFYGISSVTKESNILLRLSKTFDEKALLMNWNARKAKQGLKKIIRKEDKRLSFPLHSE